MSESGLAPYARVVTAAGVGLLVQVSFFAAVLGLQVAAPATAVLATAWVGGVGALIWFTTWILAVLQRQERMEHLEAAGEAAADALFAREVDARPAARRLRTAVCWLVPLASAVSGTCLLAIALLLSLRAGLAGDVRAHAALAATFSGGISFAGFLAGRYLLAMAVNRGGSLLRAAALFLLGSVTLLFAVTLAFACAHFGYQLPLDLLGRILPILAGIVGAEILLNQLLDFYRPRARGDMPRPSYESRLLSLPVSPGGFVATLNDAIDYQFGFEITQSWFWRLLTRTAGWLLTAGIAALLALSCIIIVEPQQQALVLRFGRIVSDPLEPGIHLKWPWPIERTAHHDVTRLRSLTIGSHDALESTEPLLWSNQHTIGPERLIMLAPARDTLVNPHSQRPGSLRSAEATATSAAPAITLAGADIFIQYRIADVLTYMTSNADPNQHFQRVAEQHVYSYLLRLDIDELIGADRTQAAVDLQRILQQAAERERLGLDVAWVGLAGIHPAQQAADAFYETVGATQEKQASVLGAQREATQILTEASGSEAGCMEIAAAIAALESLRTQEADQAGYLRQEAALEVQIGRAGGKAASAIAEARADRWRVENAERGRALRFGAELAAYRAAPQLYRARRHLETLAEAMGDARKYILGTDRRDLILRGDLKDTGSAFDALDLSQAQ